MLPEDERLSHGAKLWTGVGNRNDDNRRRTVVRRERRKPLPMSSRQRFPTVEFDRDQTTSDPIFMARLA